MAYWIDSHAHLIFDEFKDKFDVYMQRAKEPNVGRIMCVCLNVEQLEYGFKIKEQYPYVDLAVGYFPLDVKKLSEEDWFKLEEAIKDERVLAVGEIGLDYFWDTSYNELQKACFIRQIELANKYNKPIITHVRDAHDDALELLLNHPPIKGGIMHCYSGSLENAKKLEPLGFCFAFGGPLTYPDLEEGRDIIENMPLSCILVETDCPSLPPYEHLNENSESAYVHYAGELVAKLTNLDIETVQRQMQNNYERLFGKLNIEE